MFCKKDILRNFAKLTGKHLCQSLFFDIVAGMRPEACNFIKKGTLAQVFSCEFCEFSKKTFLQRTPLVAAFEYQQVCLKNTYIVLISSRLQSVVVSIKRKRTLTKSDMVFYGSLLEILKVWAPLKN